MNRGLFLFFWLQLPAHLSLLNIAHIDWNLRKSQWWWRTVRLCPDIFDQHWLILIESASSKSLSKDPIAWRLLYKIPLELRILRIFSPNRFSWPQMNVEVKPDFPQAASPKEIIYVGGMVGMCSSHWKYLRHAWLIDSEEMFVQPQALSLVPMYPWCLVLPPCRQS